MLEAKGESGFDPAAASGCTVVGEAPATKASCPAGSVQTLVIDGGSGNDVLKVENFPAAVAVTLLGGYGRDVLRGGISEDMLVDGPGTDNDDLYGKQDDDVLIANAGRDRAYGQGGSDLFVSGGICEGDIIKGGNERDNASWAQLRGAPKGETGEHHLPVEGVSASIATTEGVISRYGGGCEDDGKIFGVEFLEGSGGNDFLEGNDQHNILLGRSGKDKLLGLGGKDNLLANNRKLGPALEGETKEEKEIREDEDEKLDCGQPNGGEIEDVLKADPADKSPGIAVNCEDADFHASPAQTSLIGGIGSDPVADVPPFNLDESVIGGVLDVESVAPKAFYLLDEVEGANIEDWIDSESSGTYEGEVKLDQDGISEESRSVYLDGEDDYLDLGSDWDPQEFVSSACETVSGYSIELWVKFDSAPATREELFSRLQGGKGVSLYREADGRLAFSVANGVEVPVVFTDEAVDGGDWHHVVATMAQRAEPCEIISFMSFEEEGEIGEEPKLILTVDGSPYVLGLSGRSVFPPAMPSARNLVGAREGSEGPVNLLAGMLDDVAIYGDALTEEDIQAHMLVGEIEPPEVILLPPIDLAAEDVDEDGVADDFDNCPETANTAQQDADGDGIGDACQVEPDSDEDGIPDQSDNCPEEPNALQEDSDEDGVGDACEPE